MGDTKANRTANDKMDFEDLQKIFLILYKLLSFLIIFIITLVVILSIINLFYIIYKKLDDINKKKANEKITYNSLNNLEWLNYLKLDYNNYNIFSEKRGIYLQQLTLNIAIYFIYMIILLLLLNIGFYGILKLVLQEKMIGATKDDETAYFIDKNTQKMLGISIVFCFIISIFYSIEFKRNIFEPIKNMDDINKDINKKLSENIIQNRDLLEKALTNSSITVFKDYLKKEVNQENKEELIKKVLFTNNIITSFKKNITDIKNHNIKKQIVDYLYKPDESDDILFGFLRINSFLLYQSSNEEIMTILGDIELKSDNKIIILNHIRNLTEDIETSLKTTNIYYNNINDLWYIILMCLLCIIVYIFVIAVLLPIISNNDTNPIEIIKNSITSFYNFIKNKIENIFNVFINFISLFKMKRNE